MTTVTAIILTESDIRDYQSACGCNVDVIFIPENMQHEFMNSKAYKALFPCLSLSKLDHKILTYKVIKSLKVDWVKEGF